MDHSQLIQRSHTLYIMHSLLAMEFEVVCYFSPLKPRACNQSFEECNNRAGARFARHELASICQRLLKFGRKPCGALAPWPTPR